ncbi:uncharacterized protein TM35_000141790 [Trypanosoma theileri]|uniref:Uncharacterized protein n=1 Tax=Trypanosoma theileri TaxID=67003 RepID=A0A1X0NWP9_9TRYP|nr:uncharacterized protein TM35_000141790 [Trypanosoma theileri]ORC88968.1 hypothetical protein TM35_000141790 [Trypanosoma theileri]
MEKAFFVRKPMEKTYNRIGGGIKSGGCQIVGLKRAFQFLAQRKRRQRYAQGWRFVFLGPPRFLAAKGGAAVSLPGGVFLRGLLVVVGLSCGRFSFFFHRRAPAITQGSKREPGVKKPLPRQGHPASSRDEGARGDPRFSFSKVLSGFIC